jgi:hypothetical protein
MGLQHYILFSSSAILNGRTTHFSHFSEEINDTKSLLVVLLPVILERKWFEQIGTNCGEK